MAEALTRAKAARRDEFYTQLADIERELHHYRRHFAGKVVYCNCDDPAESMFFRYFAAGFNRLGLRKLMASGYDASPVRGTLFDDLAGTGTDGPYLIEITEVDDCDGDGAVGFGDVAWLLRNDANTSRPLEGDGDFRSAECVALLEEADIVVTNPPFSLWREYLAQLVEHDKKFLILGNKNAITYKQVFPLLQQGDMWLGVTPMGRDMLFDVPDAFAAELVRDGKEGSGYKIVDGSVKARAMAAWFTNLEHGRRCEELVLGRRYDPAMHPRYDNYDAINVDRVADIPYDWDGPMGVPMTFLDKHNPDQFEIVGMDRPLMAELTGRISRFWLGGREIYARIIIRRRQ